MKASPKRMRWYTIRPFDRKLLARLGEGMLATKFHAEAGFGFVVGDIRPAKITGRFVRKERVTRSVTNPDGVVEELLFEDFSSTSFVVSTSAPHLELSNPSRRTAEMLTTLGDLLDDKVAIIPVEADCIGWLNALRGQGVAIHTTRLVTGSIPLTDSVAVKAAFSGTRDVNEQATAFLRGRKHNAESLSGVMELKGDSAKFKVTASGAFTFTSTPSDQLLAAAKRSAGAISTHKAS